MGGGPRSPALGHQPPAIDHQPPAIGHQPPVTRLQSPGLSPTGHRPLVTRRWLPGFGHRPPGHPRPSQPTFGAPAIDHRASAASHRSPAPITGSTTPAPVTSQRTPATDLPTTSLRPSGLATRAAVTDFVSASGRPASGHPAFDHRASGAGHRAPITGSGHRVWPRRAPAISFRAGLRPPALVAGLRVSAVVWGVSQAVVAVPVVLPSLVER